MLSKIHADASKSKAVSYKRLVELEAHLRAEVDELFALAERLDGLVVQDEITRRKDRLARLAEAKAVLEERARERATLEQAAYDETMAFDEQWNKNKRLDQGRRLWPRERELYQRQLAVSSGTAGLLSGGMHEGAHCCCSWHP